MMAASYYENHPYNRNPNPSPHPYSGPPPAYPPPPREEVIPNSRPPPNDPGEESHVEEIHRDFPPGSYYHRAYPAHGSSRAHERGKDRRSKEKGHVRRARSTGGRKGHGDYYYTRDMDYDRGRRRRPRNRRPSYSESSGSSSSRSPPPRNRRRRKSLGAQATGAISSAAAAFGLTPDSRSRERHRDRSRDRHRDSRRYDDDRYDKSRRHGGDAGRRRARSDSRSPSHNRKDLSRTLTSALSAGAAEAYRARKEPGGWTGPKGKRVMTAAMGAGGTDEVLDRKSDGHGKRHMLESTLTGLATNQLVNGSRSRSRGRHGGHRSGRSGGSNTMKNLASSGALAVAGKELFDHYQRSKARGGRVDYGSDGDDDYDDGRGSRRRGHGSHKRSQSVSAYLDKGLAALGLDEPNHKDRPGRHRSMPRRRGGSYSEDESSSDEDDRSPPRNHRSSGGRRRDDVRHERRNRSPTRDRYGGDYQDVSRPRSLPSSAAGSPGPSQRSLARPHHAATWSEPGSNYEKSGGENFDDSDFDTGSSTDDERTKKRLERKRWLTGGLAGVATINAAHEMVESAQKRRERVRMLNEGEIDAEEAQKMRRKGNLKDLASLGLLGYSVKGVADSWVETAKEHHECINHQAEMKKRAQRRQQKRGRKSIAD